MAYRRWREELEEEGPPELERPEDLGAADPLELNAGEAEVVRSRGGGERG